MKKVFTFLAAALMSVAMFASREVVPTDADLASYATKTYTMCIYNDGACNGIVLNGTYAGWSSAADHATLLDFQAVEGFDGWYVVSWDDTSGAATQAGGVQAKPIQLDGSGLFNWDYQLGADAELIRGTASLVPSFSNEVDIKNIGAGIVVIDVKSWKNNPCTAVYHNYTITVVSDGCDGLVVPYVIGGMNNWSFEKMTLDAAKSQSYGVPTYTYSFKAAEATEYQVVSGLMDASGDIVEFPSWTDDAYMQKLVNGSWVRMPGEKGDNLVLGEKTNILFDLRADDLRWARCDGIVAEQVTVYIAVPEGAPAAIEMMGSFDKWTDGVEMTEYTTGRWKATVSAKATDVFKFREAGDWENQIEYYDANEDAWLIFGMYYDLVFGDYWYEEGGAHAIFLDFSNPEKYRWQIPTEEPIIPEDTIERVVVNVRVPSKCMPEAGIEIIGTFDEWTGVEMKYDASISSYVALVEATASQYFKFRSSGSWEQEIQYFDLNSEYWKVFADGELVFGQLWYDGYYYGEKVKIIELNFSDSTHYRWSNCEPVIIPDTIEAVMAQESQTKPGTTSIIWKADSTKSPVYLVYIFAADMNTYTLTPVGYVLSYARNFALPEYPGYFGIMSNQVLQYGTNYETLKDDPTVPEEKLAAFKEGWENFVDASDFTLKAGTYYLEVTGYDATVENTTELSNYTLINIAGKPEPVDPEEPVMLTIKQAENGCVKLEVNSEETYTFHIVPAEGWQIHTVMYNGIDVTSSVENGKIQLSGITISSELNITFATAPSGAENVSANKVKVFGQKENVIITNAEKNDPISIFTENGMLVKEFIADSDRMSIKLQSGLYLVKVKGLAVKVLL